MSSLKKLIPSPLLLSYHKLAAHSAAMLAGYPTKKLIMIGITGTKGKTTAANFVWSALQAGGIKTGLVGTANIRYGDKEVLNPYHMTMPGPFVMQKLFGQMVDEGCQACVIEATSEGMKQSRHIGIYFDFAIFTNLSPEHLPSHGNSFEQYKQAKTALFEALQDNSYIKTLDGHQIGKTIIANKDSEYADTYLKYQVKNKITYGLKDGADLVAKDLKATNSDVSFTLDGQTFKLNVLGDFNVYNALPAIAVARELGISDDKIKSSFEKLPQIPGRMEKIDNAKGFTVIVDYAHEKASMTALMTTAQSMVKNSGGKIIVLLGAEGGGRDKAKRPAMGQVVGEMADYVVCSNVDPYEDDPAPIAEDIAIASEKAGKTRDKNLFVILDRREGINKALSLANKGDLVLITGKGAEQSMVIDGKSIPWDDRQVVREELAK